MQSGYIISILITPLFSLISYNFEEVQLLDLCAKCNFYVKMCGFLRKWSVRFHILCLQKLNVSLCTTEIKFQTHQPISTTFQRWIALSNSNKFPEQIEVPLSLMLRDKVSLGEQYCEFFATEKNFQSCSCIIRSLSISPWNIPLQETNVTRLASQWTTK